jgi:hypothetical protein
VLRRTLTHPSEDTALPHPPEISNNSSGGRGGGLGRLEKVALDLEGYVGVCWLKQNHLGIFSVELGSFFELSSYPLFISSKCSTRQEE